MCNIFYIEQYVHINSQKKIIRNKVFLKKLSHVYPPHCKNSPRKMGQAVQIKVRLLMSPLNRNFHIGIIAIKLIRRHYRRDRKEIKTSNRGN